DVAAMREFASEVPDLFAQLRVRSLRIVCDAARDYSPEVVRSLVELGADVNEQDANNYTGLCWAVTRGRFEVAQALLECGANPNLDCPLFRVVGEKVEDPIAMAKLLLDHGADINQPFVVEGLPPRTVLSAATASKRTNLIEFLKSRGAELPSDAAAPRHTEPPRTSAGP